MKEENKPYTESQEEALLAEYSYRALHKLIKSGEIGPVLHDVTGNTIFDQE